MQTGMDTLSLSVPRRRAPRRAHDKRPASSSIASRSRASLANLRDISAYLLFGGLRVSPRTRNLVIAAFLCAACIAALVASRRTSSRDDAPPAAPKATTDEKLSTGTSSAVRDVATSASSTRATSDGGNAPTTTWLRAAWGAGRGELGHLRQQEGNAEGPMSFTLAGDDLVVVDQVNGRVVRFAKDGSVKDTSSIAPTVQDVAVTKDGRMLLLDRLGEKAITLTDASGRPTGRLSLERAGLGELGAITGMFVDGKDVYLEIEHGKLVRAGTVDGEPAEGREELVGRPSKDGTLLLTAVISVKAQGRVVVNAVDRKTAALRFARQLTFPRPLEGLVLLDSDDRGTVYVGAAGGGEGRATIACLDPSDGHALGFVTVPFSTSADESFKDFVVQGDGTIVYALRTESGVEYLTARCP